MNKKNSLFATAIVTLALIGAGCKASTPSATGDQAARPASPNRYSVTYNPNGLSQKSLTVKAGDVIEFRNSDLKAHWPASAPHPTHTLYPEFDPKAEIKPGDVWAFTPTKVGTWKFHDHLNAKDARFQGELIVQ